MSKRILNAMNSIRETIEDFDNRLSHLFKNLDNCHKYDDFEKYRQIMKDLARQMNNSVNCFVETHNLANKMSFRNLEKYLHKVMEDKISKMYEYFSRRILEETNRFIGGKNTTKNEQNEQEG